MITCYSILITHLAAVMVTRNVVSNSQFQSLQNNSICLEVSYTFALSCKLMSHSVQVILSSHPHRFVVMCIVG